MAEQAHNVRKEVIELVLEIAPEPFSGDVKDSIDLVDDLAYDSLALVELGFAIEQHFELDPIEPEDVEAVRCVGDLAQFVAHRLDVQLPG